MVCRLCQIWPKYQYDTLMGILKASVEFSAPGGQLGICWVSPCTLVSPTVQMYNLVHLLAHWYLQQHKCTTGYLQLNGALSIKLHMCHHHHFGRFHKQTNGLWVRFCHHSANPVLESYGEGLELRCM